MKFENDIQHFLKTLGFHQKYNDIKTPALGFDFESAELNQALPWTKGVARPFLGGL